MSIFAISSHACRVKLTLKLKQIFIRCSLILCSRPNTLTHTIRSLNLLCSIWSLQTLVLRCRWENFTSESRLCYPTIRFKTPIEHIFMLIIFDGCSRTWRIHFICSNIIGGPPNFLKLILVLLVVWWWRSTTYNWTWIDRLKGSVGSCICMLAVKVIEVAVNSVL